MAIKLSAKEIVYFKDGKLESHKSQNDITALYRDDQIMVVGDDEKKLKIMNDQGKQVQMVLLPKKIKKIARVDDFLYIADKHGDIFEIDLKAKDYEIKKEEIPRQTNLAKPKCFVTIKDTVVLGDSYSKIKVFNKRNMDQLLQIWVPFDGILKEFMVFKEGFISLFKRKDEDEKIFYSVHYISGGGYPRDDADFLELYREYEKISIGVSEQQVYSSREQEDGNIIIEQIDISNPKNIEKVELKRVEKGQLIDFKILKNILILSYTPKEKGNLQMLQQEDEKEFEMNDNIIYYKKV